MRQLTYAVLKEGDGGILRQAPERVLQFGEGNFIRGVFLVTNKRMSKEFF